MKLSQDAKDSLRLWGWALAIAAVIAVSLWLDHLFGLPVWLVTFLNGPWGLAAKAVLFGWFVWRVVSDVRARRAARRGQGEAS